MKEWTPVQTKISRDKINYRTKIYCNKDSKVHNELK